MKSCLTCALIFLTLFFRQVVSAQNSTSASDTMNRYYSRLANSVNEADKHKLTKHLYQLLQSDIEQDWFTAQRFFYQLKKMNVRDSIVKVQRMKFPQGELVRSDSVQTVFNEKDPKKKEKLYQAWVKQFPPAKFGSDWIQYDYARNSVATAYAEAGNVKKALQYSNMIETPAWKGEGWAGPAYKLLEKGYYKEAAGLLQKARDLAYSFKTSRRNEPGAGFAAIGYPGYTRSLVNALVKLEKYTEALPYAKELYDSSKTIQPETSETYARVLMAVGQHQQAFEVIDTAVMAGAGTKEIKTVLKVLYPKVKGSMEGYDAYIANMNRLMVEKIREHLAKQIINMPAPDFTLTDVDGNQVSLHDLKGKTVVLDFWATWCGPCIKSFPAMQTAMERLKNNPDVKFLYIHTMERETANATESAKKFITNNKYPFQVLMDLKDAQGVNKVVSSYKVSGIPTKFIIDPKGNIRFRVLGFSGGEDFATEEVMAMVEMAGKAQNEPTLNIGDPAPAMKVRRWIKGGPVNEFQKGKTYVVEFWATWCLPCIAGMPHLSKLANQYKGKVAVAGISILERAKTSEIQIDSFVQSMGAKMDYSVGREDSNYMAKQWLNAAGERGIPFAFIVDDKKVVWMGHPRKLDHVLEKVVNRSWNTNQALSERKEMKRIEALDNTMWGRLNKFMGNPGKPDSALMEIENILREEPKLKYAPRLAHYYFWSLIKTDPSKAAVYGRELMKSETYADPPYKSVTDAVGYMVEIRKTPLTKQAYEVGAEAYQAQIDNYPWSMNIPVTYDKIGDLYFLAGNKQKAIDAQKRAIDAAKNKKDFAAEELKGYLLKLERYQKM